MNIRIENLSKRFNYEWIFKNINIEFSSGNVYAITGANGSGKSTLLSVISGQVPPSKGSVIYEKNNVPIAGEDVFRHVTIAAPYMDLMEELTLEEHVQFHARLKSLRNNLSVQDVIETMYLQDARKKQIGNFSSGMKQRLKLGLAFFTPADIVILDEPLSNLDHEASSWYHRHLTGLPKEVLVLIASNNPNEYPANAITLNLADYKK